MGSEKQHAVIFNCIGRLVRWVFISVIDCTCWLVAKLGTVFFVDNRGCTNQMEEVIRDQEVTHDLDTVIVIEESMAPTSRRFPSCNIHLQR